MGLSKDTLDRRSFLKGAALVGGTAALTGLVGCEPAEPPEEESTEPKVEIPEWMPKWDESTDVVVIGFGGAGLCAAVEAYEQGVDVIVFEKSPIADGGSTGCSSGSIHTAPKSNPQEWIEKIMRGSFGTVDRPTVEKMVNHAMETPDWFDKVNIPVEWGAMGNPSVTRPASSTGRIVGYEGNEGRFLWQGLLKGADDRKIDYRLNTPVTELVQHPFTKEILGVKIKESGGTGAEKIIKANKGVVMACGGYGGSPERQYQYNHPGIYLWPWGTPYNEGDGFDFSFSVGADIWHMDGCEYSAVAFRLASEEAGASISTDATAGITPYNHIFVNRQGERFMNEAKSMNHDIESKPVEDFSASESDFINLPFFMVFDKTMFDAKPLYIGSGRSGIINTYAGVQKLCDWGPDNAKALSKGWIFQGDTLEELAAKIKGTTPANVAVNGINAEGLKASVASFNKFAETGEDLEFGRAARNMDTIVTPPFYAIEMTVSNINTQGGARRDGDCQVLNTKREKIGRLFSAGEFGSINGFVYVYGNIFEALTSGRVAGHNAAVLDSWDPDDKY
ncbi:MAG: FAD-dependent oxidoreductase [Coriobacteriales bacterium]|jgi:succinate dehydrogenase/fumarate reductase flavoprotein subunit|nr:FAD-dependent oxidoreductase [Coriobacteriales bacterium]